MIDSSSLSGDTLIACHFPVVQLPTWQLPVQALCSSAKRSGRLCTMGLTRAVSLPEQDSANREQAFTGGRRHFSSSYSSLNEDRAEEEGTSDSSGRYDSTSSPEETSCCLKKENSEARGSVRSHNSFLPTTELDEEDEDSDGDNLHRYREDSSFVLHGNSNWPLSNGANTYTVPQGDLDSECGYDGTVVGTKSDLDWLSNPNPYQLDSLHSDCQCFQVNRSGITMMPCEEQDSDRLKDNMTCCLHSPHDCSQEMLSNTEYISDSSCNSSDGVLVNFCTMYNRSNNPITPHDLSSPALHPSQSCEGSVFLNLRPVRLTPTEDLQQDDVTVISPKKELVDVTPSASCWSPQGLDSNCKLYSLEPIPPGLSSLEVSDLTACLQTQTTMAMETNQKYYKLVTCDLSSQSPSPAWSSLTGCPEGQSRGSHIPPSEHLLNHYSKEEQHKEEDVDQLKEKLFPSTQCGTGLNCSLLQTYDDQVATTSTGQTLCRKNYTASQYSPHSSNCQDTCSVSTQPSVISNEELSNTLSSENGASALENGVVRYSKAQRPTSLPIQPFVLIPAEKSQSQTQHLGCLLEQYINQKSSKSKSFQPVFNGKSKTSLCFSNLQASPMGSYCPILLEAPSSTDTCSTCTPSPECSSRRRTWCQFSRSQEHLSQCTSKSSPDLPHCSPNPPPIQVQDKRSPGKTQTSYLFSLPSVLNQSNLVKIPTFQNLINLSPEQSHVKHKHQSRHDFHSHTSYHPIFSHTPPILPVTTDSHHPNLHVSSSPPTFSPSEDKFPQHRAAPAVHSGCFHSTVAAALSSVASLSSLSSLLSLAASGLHVQEIQESLGPCGKHSLSQQSEALMLSDRPPTEFCLSPDTSYESLSISHLQRRGLLRSVSRAVDLIMAHFGNSRDPEEKMRLGNSSCSPTIAGLVLKHLCPAIQRILEDGLKDHNLDLIIGQHRNHPWTLVEVSTRITTCSSTRVLHSLVSKIQQCPHLTSHCMRLRAFLIGLLNLRGLEFWLSLLHSQKNVVTTYYHSWGFLSMSLGRCQPLFQELLLLLQPLSMLPFDLNLLLEPRLLCNSQLFSEGQRVSPLEPCSAFLVTSWPQLQGNRKTESNYNSQQTTSHHIGLHCQESLSPLDSNCISQHCGGLQATRSPWLASVPQWWQKEPDLMDGVAEGEDCSLVCTNSCSQITMSTGQEETGSNKDSGTPHVPTCDQVDSPSRSGPRWAKLFGAADTSTRAETASQSYVGAQTRRRPSEWLHLDRSQLGLLAQSIKSMKLDPLIAALLQCFLGKLTKDVTKKSNESIGAADESQLFSLNAVTGRNRHEHAAPRCEWTDDGGGVVSEAQRLRCERLKPVSMNLYRSFGNLMEAWVNEGNLYPDPPTPPSDSGTNFRSHSVDSGVETASCDTSFPASSCFFPSENAETDACTTEIKSTGLTPASTSQSPVLSSPALSSPSSSSPHLCPTKPEETPSVVHLKLEQACQRTEPQRQKDNPGPITVEEVLRRQPRAPFRPKRHASELMRGQRPDCFGPRRIACPSVSPMQMPEMRRRPMSLRCDMQRLEECSEDEKRGLSPGLCYLEQVCQMLEGIARQQMQNSVTMKEFEALQKNQDMQGSQAPDSCQTAADEDLVSCQRLENVENEEHIPTEPQQCKNYGHFRQRSSSDTTAMLHLTHVNSDCRGQHLRSNDQLDAVEEEQIKKLQETKPEETKKMTWRSKIATLRREMSSLRDTRGQQMESPEKNTPRRRLSQLFRRRRKTMPI